MTIISIITLTFLEFSLYTFCNSNGSLDHLTFVAHNIPLLSLFFFFKYIVPALFIFPSLCAILISPCIPKYGLRLFSFAISTLVYGIVVEALSDGTVEEWFNGLYNLYAISSYFSSFGLYYLL